MSNNNDLFKLHIVLCALALRSLLAIFTRPKIAPTGILIRFLDLCRNLNFMLTMPFHLGPTDFPPGGSDSTLLRVRIRWECYDMASFNEGAIAGYPMALPPRETALSSASELIIPADLKSD